MRIWTRKAQAVESDETHKERLRKRRISEAEKTVPVTCSIDTVHHTPVPKKLKKKLMSTN